MNEVKRSTREPTASCQRDGNKNNYCIICVVSDRQFLQVSIPLHFTRTPYRSTAFALHRAVSVYVRISIYSTGHIKCANIRHKRSRMLRYICRSTFFLRSIDIVKWYLVHMHSRPSDKLKSMYLKLKKQLGPKTSHMTDEEIGHKSWLQEKKHLCAADGRSVTRSGCSNEYKTRYPVIRTNLN